MEKEETGLYYFRESGSMAIGPIEASSKSNTMKKAREMGFKPVEAWLTSRKEIGQIVENNRQIVKGTGLFSTD